MKNKYKEVVIILVCILLGDLFLLFLDWLDLRCFLNRGPVSFSTIRQFFSYPGPMIELIIAVVLAVPLVVVVWKGREKREHLNTPEE